MCQDCATKKRHQDKKNSLLAAKSQITGIYPAKPAPAVALTPAEEILKDVIAPPILRALNTFDSAVVDHCVKALIACQMDAVKAVKMIGGHEDAKTQAEMVEILKTDPRIKSQLHYDLTALGLDEDSKKKFLATMSHWLYNESDPRLRATAARVFMRAFISEKVEEHRVEDLPIRDLSEGIKAMLAEAPKHDEPVN
jgi:hypothetical protein